MDKKWIPRGYKEIVHAVYDRRHKMIGLYEDNGKEYIELVSKKSLRELVSTDSGLWQFVCENKMEKKMEKNHRGIWINSWHKDAYESYPVYIMEKYEYWILESALKDESELEEFLLSNIKVEGEM